MALPGVSTSNIFPEIQPGESDITEELYMVIPINTPHGIQNVKFQLVYNNGQDTATEEKPIFVKNPCYPTIDDSLDLANNTKMFNDSTKFVFGYTAPVERRHVSGAAGKWS